jgi:hypothetical protein
VGFVLEWSCSEVARRKREHLSVCVSIVVTIGMQNSMADRRAVKLGDACLAYCAKYHRYPKDLKALVPEFISSVPVARYGLLGADRFSYFCQEDDREPMLYYEAIPPFGRRFYHMESRSLGVPRLKTDLSRTYLINQFQPVFLTFGIISGSPVVQKQGLLTSPLPLDNQ